MTKFSSPSAEPTLHTPIAITLFLSNSTFGCGSETAAAAAGAAAAAARDEVHLIYSLFFYAICGFVNRFPFRFSFVSQFSISSSSSHLYFLQFFASIPNGLATVVRSSRLHSFEF